MKKFLIFLSLVVVIQAQEIISSGKVLVNGLVLTKNTKIIQGDTIETSKNSRLRFNIGKDAFLTKGKSKFSLDKLGDKRVLNIINGGVMAAFGGGNHGVSTPNMTAGIRGTGIFALVKEGKTYFCTCYGHTNVTDTNKNKIELKSSHHKMIWITPSKIKVTMDFEEHKDEELILLESMVGRENPFKKN